MSIKSHRTAWSLDIDAVIWGAKSRDRGYLNIWINIPILIKLCLV